MLLLLMVSLCSSAHATDIAINAENFPDENFRKFVKASFDKNNDNLLSDGEISVVESVNVESRDIASVEGVKYFTNMKWLLCQNNRITTLDLSGCSGLYQLSCNDNQLTSINLSGCSQLNYLAVSNNQLTELDLSRNKALEYFIGGDNQLTSLNLSGCSKLLLVYCENNRLTTLNLSGCSSLQWLHAENNQLTTLNLSGYTNLQRVRCYNNRLTELDVSGCSALELLYCRINQLTTLKLNGCTALTSLYCENNKLFTLMISECPALQSFGCYGNLFTELDVSSNENLFHIYCGFPIESDDSGYDFNLTDFLSAYQITYAGRADDIRAYDQDRQVFAASSLSSFPAITQRVSSGKNIIHVPAQEGHTLTYLQFTYKGPNARSREMHIDVYPFVEPESAPVINTSSLPEGTINTPYTYTLTLSKDVSVTWTFESGTLPDGISFDSTSGTISGTPGESGAFTFTVKAENDAGTDTRNLTLVIPFSAVVAPAVTTRSLTNGLTSAPYGFQLKATGTPPLTWTLISGDLPSGVSLGTSGFITGTPTAAGTYPVTLQAANSAGNASADFTLTITEAPASAKPVVTTSILDDAAADKAYSFQLMASGTPPFTWSVKGKLPDGLSLSSSGLISGTPTKKGKKAFTVTAENDKGSGQKKLALTVHEPPQLITETLKEATVAKKYSFGLKAKGTKPLTWTLEGNLPDGITFDKDKGKFAGTPTINDMGMFRVTLSNPGGEVTKVYSLDVKALLPTISPNKLKAGKYEKAYSAAFKTKGTAPITLTLSGYLPSGLTFNSKTNKLEGTPTETCTDREITAVATNMGGRTEMAYTLTVQGNPPKITTKSLPDAANGTAYSVTLEATGTPSITWSADGLPKGLSISSRGQISGTPTEGGTFKVKVSAQNNAKTASKNYKLNVKSAPVFSSSSVLEAGTVGKSYSKKLSASGTKTITFSISGGTLPPGITLKKDTLKGKPTSAGTYSFTVKAENSVGSASQTCSLTIMPKTAKSSGSSFSAVREAEPEEEYIIVAVLPEVSVDVSGMYDFSITLSPDAEAGSELVWLAGSSEPSEDDSIAEFFDEYGEEIASVPEDRTITVSAWLNTGRVYKPAVAVRR